MPIYEFRCAEGHVSEGMFSMSARPDELACTTCKQPAPRITSVTAYTMGSVPPKKPQAKEVGGGVTIRCPDIICNACEHGFYEALTSEEPLPPCPKCGSADVREKIGVPGADWSNRAYPYYDRGLGMVLNSPGHRAQVCKERGIIPVDGDYDEDKYISKLENRDADLHAEYTKYADRLENDPRFVGYRRARDQGRM